MARHVAPRPEQNPPQGLPVARDVATPAAPQQPARAPAREVVDELGGVLGYRQAPRTRSPRTVTYSPAEVFSIARAMSASEHRDPL